jgi:hypothetical protein
MKPTVPTQGLAWASDPALLGSSIWEATRPLVLTLARSQEQRRRALAERARIERPASASESRSACLSRTLGAEGATLLPLLKSSSCVLAAPSRSEGHSEPSPMDCCCRSMAAASGVRIGAFGRRNAATMAPNVRALRSEAVLRVPTTVSGLAAVVVVSAYPSGAVSSSRMIVSPRPRRNTTSRWPSAGCCS